jgi:peptidoglycan/LPS O-acetylase OafA/YrhL
VLWGVIANAWTDWKTVLTHIFVLQAWTPDQRYLLGLNTVMWTLSSEMFLYLLFPALILMLVNFSRNALKLVAVACVAGSFVLPWLVGKNFTLRQPPPELAPLEGFDNQFVYWFTLMFPPMRLFQFVLGMSVALLMRQGLKYIPNIPVALVIFAAGLTLTNLYLPVESKNVAGMLIPIAILIAALAKADLESKWNPFRLRPLLFVGKISYSIYAVHILFILFTMVQIPQASGAWDWPRVWLANAGLIDDPKVALPGWANFGIFFTYVAVIMFTAWLLYKFVEQPVGRFIRNRLRETKPATPAPTNGQVHPAEAPALAASAAQRD